MPQIVEVPILATFCDEESDDGKIRHPFTIDRESVVKEIGEGAFEGCPDVGAEGPTVVHADVTGVTAAAERLRDSADEAGCDGDLIVVDRTALADLLTLLGIQHSIGPAPAVQD
jgi:hypothetical protein